MAAPRKETKELISERESGTFVTFYSFKGGVGRTRAVANTAYELAQRGYSVLVIDFDLEAPDLPAYFAPWIPDGCRLDANQGFVDLIVSLQKFLTTRDPTFDPPKWDAFVSPLKDLDGIRARSRSAAGLGYIHLMTAGRQDEDYPSRVASIDWSGFYEKFDGGRFIEYLRQEISACYNFVLIDSRTGYADIAGIGTIQMADILVPIFTASRSSLQGVETVVCSVRHQHQLLGRKNPLRVIPIPARIDLDVKAEDRKLWMDWLCEQRVAEWMRESAPELTAEQGFQRVMLFYQRQFAFREEAECYIEDQTGQPELNGRQYRQIVDLILRVSETPAVTPRHRFVTRWDLPFLAQLWKTPVERQFVESIESFAWSAKPEEAFDNLLSIQGRLELRSSSEKEGDGERDLHFIR